MDPDPFDDRAARIHHGNGADREIGIVAVAGEDPMFEDERAAFGDGEVPRVDRRLGIVGMDCGGPAIALVIGEGLAGQRRPAGLVA